MGQLICILGAQDWWEGSGVKMPLTHLKPTE